MASRRNTPDGPTRARSYERVSKLRDGNARSVDEQAEENARRAAEEGWTLGESYTDTVSASKYATKDRDGYGKLIADLEAENFNADVLTIWESSRGSRKVSEWARLIELCEERGVRIHVTSHGRTYDPADPRDVRAMHEDATDAQYESGKISGRTRRALAANAAAGKPHGKCPFGYRRTYDAKTRQLIAQDIYEPEAKLVRELFARIIRGHSLRSIVSDFQARGITHASGRPFTHGHLRVMAMTPAYAGLRVHHPGRKANGDRWSLDGNYVEAVWPATVDKGTFYAVRRILTDPARRTSRPGRGVHLLSGLVVCDVCGSDLSALPSREVYRCRRKLCVVIQYDELNDYAEAAMLAYLSRPDNVERLTRPEGNGAELQCAKDDTAKIRSELDDLAANVSSGALSATLAAKAEPGILARLKVAEQREQALSTPSVLRGLIAPGKDVNRRWQSAEMSTKREVARLLLSPGVLGELRVKRSPVRGQRFPITERVTWRTER